MDKDAIREVMRELGKRGAAVTNGARTPEERSQASRHAVQERWRKWRELKERESK